MLHCFPYPQYSVQYNTVLYSRSLHAQGDVDMYVLACLKLTSMYVSVRMMPMFAKQKDTKGFGLRLNLT